MVLNPEAAELGDVHPSTANAALSHSFSLLGVGFWRLQGVKMSRRPLGKNGWRILSREFGRRRDSSMVFEERGTWLEESVMMTIED